MARNRIIYNVQGLFVSPYSGEQNPTTDYYLSGYQILKRIEKVQNFNYGIDNNRINLEGFASKKNIFRGLASQPTVNFTFSYTPDGFTNENRLNFDTANFLSSIQAPMFSGLCQDNSIVDKKDFYLVINNNDNDLLGNYPLTDYFINPNGVNDVIDPNSPNYSLLYFQNSYLTKYSFSVNLGEVPSVEQTYIADNIIFYISGSGVNYTTLNVQSGNQNIENTKLIIPKNINPSDLSGQNILLPGDASVTFYRNPSHYSTNIISSIPENYTAGGLITKVGNTFTKNLTDGYDAQVYSSIGYSNNMYVEGSVNSSLKLALFGLSTNPTINVSYENINYAWFVGAGGGIRIYENGIDILGLLGLYTPANKFRIEYDGITVTYFLDGVAMRSVNVPIPNATYYFNSSLANIGASISVNYGTFNNIQYYNDTIQSLDYSLSFDRQNLRSLNYKFPQGRNINFPVNCDLNMSFITEENFNGSFFDTLNRDDDYNIVVDFNNCRNGVFPSKFIFSGARFNNINYNSSIGTNKTANLSFNFDIDPDFGNRGVFASGNVLYAQSTNNPLLGTESAVNYELSASQITLIPENFTAGGLITKVGNTFTKNLTDAYDAQVYSSIGYNTNMYMDATINSSLKLALFGLSTNPTINTSFENINYAWAAMPGGGLRIYENGIDLGIVYVIYTPSNKPRIEYDGTTVTYFLDGVPVRSVKVPIPNQTYYFDSALYNIGASISVNYGVGYNLSWRTQNVPLQY